MSMPSVTLEIRKCRIIGTMEVHDKEGSAVLQIDEDLSPEVAARILASWPVPPAMGYHNHYEYVKPRVIESLRQMGARFLPGQYVKPYPYERKN